MVSSVLLLELPADHSISSPCERPKNSAICLGMVTRYCLVSRVSPSAVVTSDSVTWTVVLGISYIVLRVGLSVVSRSVVRGVLRALTESILDPVI